MEQFELYWGEFAERALPAAVVVGLLDLGNDRQAQVPLRERLAARFTSQLSLLFVNAGITNNTTGSREVYRGSKAALNQFMRSFAVRQAGTARSLLLMAPGWIKTDLGGDDAPFTIAENVLKIVDVMLAKRSVPGLAYLDFRGDTVPW